ncbi:hypothetical protein NEUTE2DRAFT_147351 [Neurospora tetrasperma FGSC 2509]|nr:hypothetical protein NEUTE2DRAFT_147351 [Neurospora tetrasperma FGSC 2509]
MHYDHYGIHQCCPVNSMDKFTNFQRLPAELRNIIWEFSLPEPRVYEILDAPNSKRKTPPHEGLMFANIHPEPPPALAAVCHESRSFVLHNYKPLTLGRTTKYIDLSRDILLLEPYLLIKRLHRTLHFMSQISFLRDNINRLALGTSYGIYTGICHPVLSWKVSKTNMGKLLTNLAKFPRLKVLIFIVHQEFQFEFDFRFPGTMTPIPNYPLQHSVSTTLQPLFTSGPSATGFPSPISSVSSSIILPSRSSSSNPIPTLAEPASNGLHFYSTVSNSSSNNNTIATPGDLYKPPYSSPLSFPSLLPLSPPYSLFSPQDCHLPPPLPPFPLFLQQQQQHQHQQPQPSQPQRRQLVHQAYRFKFDIEANINHAPRRPHLNELLYYPLDIDKEDDGDGENFDYYNFSGGGNGGSSNSNGNSGWTNNDHDDDYDDDEDVRGDVNRVGGGRAGGGGDRGGGSGGEWSDPWPTNDDWRRFRQRFQKAVRQSLEVMERHRLACLATAEAAKVADGGEKHSAKGGKESSASGRRKKTGKGTTTTTTTKAAEKNSWSGRASREAEWEWERQWEREREPLRAGLEGRIGKHATRIRVPAIKGASLLWRYTRGGSRQSRGEIRHWMMTLDGIDRKQQISERRPRAWKQVRRGKKTQLDSVVVTVILVVITALDFKNKAYAHLNAPEDPKGLNT